MLTFEYIVNMASFKFQVSKQSSLYHRLIEKVAVPVPALVPLGIHIVRGLGAEIALKVCSITSHINVKWKGITHFSIIDKGQTEHFLKFVTKQCI